jgi:signal transduction histidine kinase
MPPLRSLFARHSIRFQLFWLVAVVSAFALVISMAGGALLEWNKQQAQVRQSLATTARATGIAASAALAFYDSKAATQALRILAAQPEIEAAALYPPEGNHLATYGDQNGIPENAGPLSEHLPDFTPWSSSTTLYQPILLDDTVIGHIYLRASLLDYRQTYLQQALLAIGANLLGLLLAIGLGLRFINRITLPVQQLAETSRQVRDSRNFSLRATPPDAGVRHDEISMLIDSFNAMLAEIEEREHELASYHDSLERMVLERTQDLHAANLELLLAKEDAEAATLAKSRFLAAASHDLRQPIQAIKLFKEALNRTALNDEQQRISKLLARSIQSLGELLNALLDISRLDAGAVTPAPEVITIHALFSHIDEEFSIIAAAKSLRFKLYFPLGEMNLFIDRKLLQSLLRNLIGNAIKYTAQGGVLVAIRRRGQQVVIQVWDTGIGIAPEHMGMIYDEYFQVANPERDQAKGLGLGLAIARRLANLLKTEIVCRSRPGRGSVFEFSLPLMGQGQEAHL